ncbi:glutamate carboxypeptidase [Sandarakinorhabdus sp. AAP62]|uniref:glutamate carboxypeptidase n=1 Tax=Sandarakinorhabdus sp. AAP62 TaxID=1248916 RepID=UPI0003193F13|nr:glutamate carboxypeptidase [Sandarakinorhabdus sp. AAP62]
MKTLIAAAAVLLATSALAAPKPDNALLKAATAEAPAVTGTLKSLVEVETGSGDAEGLETLGRYLEARFTQSGGSVSRVKPLPGTVGDIIVARWKGTGKGKLLLIAHMDTVYQRGALAKAPFKVVEGDTGPLAYGPGIADDKAGIAVILHTLPLLNARDYAELTVLINTDEERGSVGSGPIITEMAKGMSAVLSFEPTVHPEAMVNGTSGTNTVIVTIAGKSAHAGAAPETGINAMVEAAHVIAVTKDLDRGPGKRRFNWTVVNQDRGVRNIIPNNVTLIGDLRTSTLADVDQFRSELNERLKTPALAGAQVVAEVRVNRPPFDVSPASSALIEEAQAIYGTLGRRLPLMPRTGGGTDAGYAALAGVPVLEFLGLPGAGYHTTDAEYVHLESVPSRLYLAASLIRRLGR